MFLMAIAWVFAVPAYYLARSKGRLGGFYAILILLMGVPAYWIGPAVFIAPGIVVLVLYALPAKPGAPGESYLQIEFSCPECNQVVAFPRHREGVAVLCPKCGELISVPTDEHSAPATGKDRPVPDPGDGIVIYDSFGRPEPAHRLAAILNDNGVTAEVVSDSGGGVLPHVGNTLGYRVRIDASQWELATEIEAACREAGGDDAAQGG